MNGEELQPLAGCLTLLCLGAPPFALALRLVRRVVPVVPPVPARWSLREALLVLAAPFVAFGALALVLSHPGALEALLANQLALGAGVGLAAAFAARRPQRLWGLGLVARPGPAAFTAVVVALLPLFVSAYGLGGMWVQVCRSRGWQESQDAVRMILDLHGLQLAAAALIAVAFGPLIEELFFRGFLLSAAAQVVGERAALWYVSILFAALHGVAAMPVILALALFLGWLQQRARCIWLPWLAHACFNGTMLGLALGARGG